MTYSEGSSLTVFEKVLLTIPVNQHTLKYSELLTPLLQLVFRQDLAQGGGEAATPRGERERNIPGARLGTQPARIFPEREGLGGDERISCEALQD